MGVEMDRKIWAGIAVLVISALCISIVLSNGKMGGKSVGVPPYERIASLSSTTEILCDLGAVDKIAGIDGVSKESPYYEILRDKPQIGGGYHNLNVESILGLKPDLVFCWEGHADVLRSRDLNVYPTGAYDIEGIMGLIKEVGRLAGKGREADKIIYDMKTRIKKVEEKLKNAGCRPLVYFEAGTLGKSRSRGSLTHDLIVRAGGINIAGDESVSFPLLSSECIIEKNPDIIIVEEYGASVEEIKARRAWRDIKAIKNNRVYKSSVYYTNYTPRCLDGLEQYTEWFHPEIFR
jgi:iron complex transport system substrate-binding protein